MALLLTARAWGGEAPRLIFIHGFADGAFAWNALLSRLQPTISGVAIDLRGHGDSPWDSEQRYDSEAYAADVLAFFDALCPSGAILVGHSLGAQVAIRVAAARSSQIRGLVMVDGGPELNEEATVLLREQMAQLPWRYRTVEDFMTVLTQRHPLASREVLEKYAVAALRRTADHEFELKLDPALRAGVPLADDPAVWKALTSIRCPKLLARGAISSFLSQQQSERICHRAPNCRLVTVPDAGHSIPLDNPDGLCEVVRPFLAEVA